MAPQTTVHSHSDLERVRAAILQDADLVVCKTCGMQYGEKDPAKLTPAHTCPVCEDERQYVPADGQKWTRIGAWLPDAEAGKVTASLVPEPGEPRILRIVVKGISVGIGQTPIVIVTKHGIVIWDCCAVLIPSIVEQIQSLQHEHGDLPLLGLAISHPHFYTTALTWAMALKTQIIVSAADQKWWMRRLDDAASQDAVILFEGERHTIAPGLTVVRCGGHFDGSSVLHWDRAEAPGPSSINNAQQEPLSPSGAVFCADTFAPNMDRKTFTFMWSYPNFVPLPPADVVKIWHALRPFTFDDVIGGWPGRYVHGDARAKVLESARRFVRMEGHDHTSFD